MRRNPPRLPFQSTGYLLFLFTLFGDWLWFADLSTRCSQGMPKKSEKKRDAPRLQGALRIVRERKLPGQMSECWLEKLPTRAHSSEQGSNVTISKFPTDTPRQILIVPSESSSRGTLFFNVMFFFIFEMVILGKKKKKEWCKRVCSEKQASLLPSYPVSSPEVSLLMVSRVSSHATWEYVQI